VSARVETPDGVDDLCALVRECAESAQAIRVVGSGHESMLGNPVEANVTVDTRNLNAFSDFDPDELVVRVGAGVTIGELRETLAEHQLRAVLPEAPSERTIGGVVATGTSGYTRLRYGPIRNHVIGIVLVSGTGDVVRAGGQVVKNVTGYDISRLAAGSMGRLGIIAEVALRVFSVRGTTALLDVADPELASRASVRPLAVIGTREGSLALIEGSEAAIEAQVGILEAPRSRATLPSSVPWQWRATVRSRPASQHELLGHLPDAWDYIAQFGVGLTEVGGNEVDVDDLVKLRSVAEEASGRLVVHKVPPGFRANLDPWGSPPGDLEIQRRLVESFDPRGIFNPGILPGGL